MSDRDHSTRQRIPNDTTWSEPLHTRPPSAREERLRKALQRLVEYVENGGAWSDRRHPLDQAAEALNDEKEASR